LCFHGFFELSVPGFTPKFTTLFSSGFHVIFPEILIPVNTPQFFAIFKNGHFSTLSCWILVSKQLCEIFI